jgi:uncharacterized glyoxalase superfamily protein PhnB
MIDDPAPPYLASAVFYQDAKAALLWLEQAFGFEPSMVLIDQNGDLAHSQMRFGQSVLMVGQEWSERHRSPRSMGGINTQTVNVNLADDIDGHCERARTAGAVILQEPETQFYGDRTYRAEDPEGHIWTFSQTVQVMTPEEWDKASGLTTRTRL